MTDEHDTMPHTPIECPDAAERAAVMAEVVSVLFEQRAVCPACARGILLEIVAGGDEVFEMMRQEYMHLH